MIYRKYAKKYRHNMKSVTFLKSNFKYKRRTTHSRTCQQKRKQKYKLPANEETEMTNDKEITKGTTLFNKNIKLDKFLRIFILIMQQAKTTNNTISSKNKSDNNRLVTRLVAKMKAFKNANTKSLRNMRANVNVEYEYEYEYEDVISENHRAYTDANKDTDINVDTSNITDEISHQQHNYDKVSTITSTPIKCQRRKPHQMRATKSMISSSSPPPPPSFSLTTTTASMTMTTLISSPSITNYGACHWSTVLRHHVRENPTIHKQQYQYHHHAMHTSIKSLASTSKELNASKSSSNDINFTAYTPCASGAGTGIYQSVDQYVNAIWNRSYTLSCLLLTLFIALAIGVRSTTAGACWQTVLDNGKCNEIFSLNISKSDCCGANQEFAYTEREPTNVEYFFATAIGGGMECAPCLESCRNVKCGPSKKCVKRKGRPKCICAPECGAARRKRKQREQYMQQEQQQHHTLNLFSSHVKESYEDIGDDDRSRNAFKIKIEKSQQSRDTRSLSSEITNVNLDLENEKNSMISTGATPSMERHHCKEHNQNQRKLLHIHTHHIHGLERQYTHLFQQQQQQQHQPPEHKNQEPKDSRRLLITANVEHTEKPTTRRLQIFSNVRATHGRRYSSRNNNRNGQQEDTDPSDYNDANDEEENYNYNDAEDDAKEAKKKNSSRNKNNRNDDSTRLLNQSSSRHKLKTNTKPNNNNNRNINNKSNSTSTSNINKNRNRNRNTNNKNNYHHDLQTTKIQQNASNNNTRVKHPIQNGRHVENSPHHRHHNHNHHSHHQHHRLEQQQKERQVQLQNHPNHSNHHQKQSHGRRKHNNKTNKQNHEQLSIPLKKPKNNKDYNITTTTTSTNISNTTNKMTTVGNTTITTTTVKANNNLSNSNTDAIPIAVPSSTLPRSRIVKTAIATTTLKLSSPSAAIPTTTTKSAFKIDPHQPRSQLLLPLPATSSTFSATPVNSIVSANDGAIADDYYHSRFQNHGSEIATSSLSSATSLSSSSHSQMSVVLAFSSPEPVVVTVSAKGEGVSLRDHKHHIEMPMKIAFNNNNNNNDNIISELESNLHNNNHQQQQPNQEQDQLLQTQSHPQSQHNYQTPLYGGISEQFDLIGFTNIQQQQLTSSDNVRTHNPVCGTDGRTYNTECQLRKRACRTENPNLKIAYRGHCRTTCSDVKCLNGFTCVEDQNLMPHCIACKIECPQDDYDNDVADATRAVCGADGNTYKSVCDINRMICKIGRSIGVAYPGPCRGNHVTCDDINCGPKQVCLIDLLTHKPRCNTCRYKCSRKRRPLSSHFEEGKICGVNNRTYNSWCEMRKDSCSTGFYIDIKYSGECH